jgi:natural product precursor
MKKLKKFTELSRAEMKKIAGGTLCNCAAVTCGYMYGYGGPGEVGLTAYVGGFNCNDPQNFCGQFDGGHLMLISCTCASAGACS